MQADLLPFYENAVARSAKGYNTTILAYGAGGSGKTHTMFGSKLQESEDDLEYQGVVYHTISAIYAALEGKEATIYGSYLCIQDEQIIDLLQESGHEDIKIRYTPELGVETQNLARLVVSTPMDCI